MILYCPRCGAPYGQEPRGEWMSTREQCADCGVAVRGVPGMLRPSDDEVRFALDEWAPGDRVLVTAALIDIDAPYRWEPGLVLAVPAPAESDVDRILEDVAQGELGPDGSADAEADGGERAQAAMADLFLATDRLQHAPWDRALANHLGRAVAAVDASLPPYGVDSRVWRHIQKLGSALAEAASEEVVDDETVASASRSLRDLLRDLV